MTKWIALGATCWIVGCASTGPSRGGPPVAATRADCVSQTGSAIPGAGCTGPGRTYSQSDIANTGKTTAAGALRELDPSITIQH